MKFIADETGTPSQVYTSDFSGALQNIFHLWVVASVCLMTFLIVNKFNIWDVLRDLVLFVQFKKREKDPWRSADFF